MPTLYCDFENGNDNYAGTSFAVLAQGTDGRINSSGIDTFSSASASFPNDGSLIDQYLSIFNGTIYAVYRITQWQSSTSLVVAAISGGTAMQNISVDRQYYIGGRWKTFTNGATAARIAPGDTIRVMASPDPTSLGVTGVWTSAQLQATKAISSSTNATPIAITSTAHGYSNGDTVVITGHSTNTNANGTWEITVTGANTFTLDGSVGNGTGGATGTVRLRNNTRIKLASSLTQNIECTGEFTNWTGVTNVTTTLNPATFKEHRASQQIAIAAAFTTGLACYKALPSTLDLSGYQQVSFWIQQVNGTLASAGAITLRLCSDSAGATTVNTITIPAIPASSVWIPITIDTGAALGSSINSIAFYVATDLGAQTFLLDNIIACKASSSADSLSLPSLIGKNTSGEQWWPIQSINGTRVMLDYPGAAPNSASIRGYYGTSETVTTYKREPISTLNHGLGTVFGTIADKGSLASPIVFSGGWNRTDMSTQTGDTFYDGNYVTATGLSNSLSGQGMTLRRLGVVRFSSNGITFNLSGPNSNSKYTELSDLAAIACGNGFVTNGTASSSTIHNNVFANSCGGGFQIGGTFNPGNASGSILSSITCIACQTAFIGYGDPPNLWPTNVSVENSSFSNCATGISAGRLVAPTFNFITLVGCDTPMNLVDASYPIAKRSIFNNLTCDTAISVNTSVEFPQFYNSSVFRFTGARFGGFPSTPDWGFWVDNVYLYKTTITDSTEVADICANQKAHLFSHNHDNTAGNHKIFTDGGLISAATDQRNTASGISWKLQPTSTNRSSTYPLDLSLAKVAVAANSLVTVKAWMRRDNSGLTMRLVCKGGQIAGVSSDVTSSVTTTNAWEELTITFTPTEAGVVEITAEAWGGTTFSGWVDDMTISQA